MIRRLFRRFKIRRLERLLARTEEPLERSEIEHQIEQAKKV